MILFTTYIAQQWCLRHDETNPVPQYDQGDTEWVYIITKVSGLFTVTVQTAVNHVIYSPGGAGCDLSDILA